MTRRIGIGEPQASPSGRSSSGPAGMKRELIFFLERELEVFTLRYADSRGALMNSLTESLSTVRIEHASPDDAALIRALRPYYSCIWLRDYLITLVGDEYRMPCTFDAFLGVALQDLHSQCVSSNTITPYGLQLRWKMYITQRIVKAIMMMKQGDWSLEKFDDEHPPH